MGQFDHLHEFARRVGEMENALRTPAGFFAERSDDYLRLAVEVARATLAGFRPTDLEPGAWEDRIDEILSTLTWSIVSHTTLRLHLRDQDSSPDILASAPLLDQPSPVTVEDVFRWIDLGAAGLPVSAESRDLPSEQPLRSGQETTSRRPETTAGLNDSRSHLPDELMEAIASAWDNAFRLRIREDLLDWMHQEISSALTNSPQRPPPPLS